jgi:5'-nucleotidase
MSILLVNDDGYHSLGLEMARKVLSKIDRVVTVVPELDVSGIGHAITLNMPLRIREVATDQYIVNGTPVDCVKIGIREILKDDPPRVVVAGINPGANIGVSVHYSGTVAVAAESTIMQFPAVAISVDCHKEKNAGDGFETAAEFLPRLVANISKNRLPAWTFLSVNVPNVKLEEIRGVRIVPQGGSYFEDYYVRRESPSGTPYFWISGKEEVFDARNEIDHHFLRDGFITVTPLHLDMTAYDYLNEIKEWNWRNG